MNLALDRITGAKIRASLGKDHKTYKCPVCLAPVLLVDSSTQVAHFRHHPHTAKPDCPFYHTGSGYDISTAIRDKAFRTRRARLFARITRTGVREQWQLLVVVPRIEDFSSFTLTNSANFGRIRMDSVDNKGREFPVHPVEDSYKLRLSSSDGPDEELIDGLSKMAIFHLSASLGSRIEARESLVAGGAYTIIHQDFLERSAPPDVQFRKLESVAGWHASIIRLPMIISSDAKDWVGEVLRTTVQDVPASASVVWPAAVEETSDGTWLIPLTQKVIVGTLFPTSKRNFVRLVHEDNSTPSETLFDDRTLFLKIEGLATGYHELQFSPPTLPLVPLALGGMTRKPRSEAFTFEIAEGDTVRVETLWSRSLQQSFKAIADRKAELRGIGVPRHCKTELKSWRGGKLKEKQFLGEDVIADSELLRRFILEELNDDECSFCVDAGGFGVVCYPEAQKRTFPVARSQTNVLRNQWLHLAAFGLRQSNAQLRIKDVDDGLEAHARQLGILT